MSEKNDFQLITDLPVSTCIDRLRHVTDEKIFRLFGGSDREVIGSIQETGFVWRKKLKGKNSFQMLLHGRFAPQEAGTRIDCHAAMAKGVKVFMAFWFAIVVAVCSVALFEEAPALMNAAQSDGAPIDFSLFFVLIPFGMIIFGILLVWGGRYLARDDSDFMRDLLCRTLDARLAEESTQNRRPQAFPTARNPTVER